MIVNSTNRGPQRQVVVDGVVTNRMLHVERNVNNEQERKFRNVVGQRGPTARIEAIAKWNIADDGFHRNQRTEESPQHR